MKKINVLFLCLIGLFVCVNKVNASEIYCESGYTLYTNSSGKQKCKKKIGVPMTEYNKKTCSSGTLIDGACYSVKDPLIDGCESGYKAYTDVSGNKSCKKELNDSENSELIETFCKNNTSCGYLKEPNKSEMKCESEYKIYTDSSGNKKCKKSLGAPMTEYGKKTCARGTLIEGTCYSIKDPIESGNVCGSGYKIYKDSSGKQMCKKTLNDSEINELMTKVCETDTSNCKYIKPIIEKNDKEDGKINLGTEVPGCEVIPEVIRKWINNILKFIRYIALALVIALGALDFMKAAASGEPDAMKKAGQSFMKRMIAVIILFLLPMIVDFILNMINIYGVDADNIDCMKPTN